MRKFFYTNLLLMAVAIISNSCHDTTEALSTELRVSVTSGGNAQSGATVKLYRTQTDMEARVRPVDSATTSSSGTVAFKNLQSVQYYIHTYYDDGTTYYDNSSKEFNVLDDLIDGAITNVSIPIEAARPSTPTKLVINSVEVIRFDTTEWSRQQSKNCSKDLIVQLTAEKNVGSPLVVSTSQTATFCYYQGLALNIPTVDFDSPVELALNTYNAAYLDYFYYDNTNTFTQIPITGIAASISAVIFSDFIKGSGLKGEAYPVRLRAFEAEVKSPPGDKYAKYIVDLKVSWK